jgi:hypothetical protein
METSCALPGGRVLAPPGMFAAPALLVECRPQIPTNPHEVCTPGAGARRRAYYHHFCAGAPKGRSYHASFGDPNALHVYDVWDSQADFDAFGATLMPILAKHGIDPGQPQIAPIYKIIVG